MPGFRTAVVPDEDADILVRGPVTTQDIAYVGHAVAGARLAGTGAGHLRVKLAEYRGGDREPVAVVQINVELAGRMVRAQAYAGPVEAAIDAAVAALVPRIDRLARRLAHAEAGPPSFTGEPWDLRQARTLPPVVRIDGKARRLARHKACPPAAQTIGAAALTMDLRDYDFHLFVDEAGGQDAVLTRAGAAGYRVAADRPDLLGSAPDGVPVADAPSRLPGLTLPEAVLALDASAAAFLAFTGVGSDRAAVLYRRFDGHLGLLSPLW
ncbi:sigma 54 modulation/S30EA ribosomal C-terminal domain-containing protein [Couchioplanes caeruleus]|uniref:sigma 54 modulation/S30EA ribosomal C-terminal domain-containing protein n=1 Tax=Couchioplanes caeruleus TaxID=56438 RepID=UPI0020BD5D28|nr:sigma 54 modulation/S30EA ribosomal C-terminal domain-containing protein [Couchioplanes caeruleus]UQU61771.1 sigma 54 modulation/S30EA ribosomal C-terminal domain-containing protein [Couchioplanes caeruleus]